LSKFGYVASGQRGLHWIRLYFGLVALGTNNYMNPATQPLHATVALQDLHPAAQTIGMIAFAVALTVLFVVLQAAPVQLVTLVVAAAKDLNELKRLFVLVLATPSAIGAIVSKISSPF
jgi:hypothetical protein